MEMKGENEDLKTVQAKERKINERIGKYEKRRRSKCLAYSPDIHTMKGYLFFFMCIENVCV